MPRTRIKPMPGPTTSPASWAPAMMVPLERLASGSSDSRPGASPDASCQAEVGPPPSFLLRFESGSALSSGSLLELTTDHDPAAEVDVAAEAAGATGSGAAAGSAARGAGVHAGSLEAGMGVGSGAGRNGSAGAGG